MLKLFFFFLVFSLCMPLHSEVSCSFAARDCQAGCLRKSLQNWQHGITQQEQLQLHSEWSGCACNMSVHKVLFKWQRKQITRKLHGFFFFSILPLAVIILFLLTAHTAFSNTIAVFVSFSASHCLTSPRTTLENWWTNCLEIISIVPIPYSGTCCLAFECLRLTFSIFPQQSQDLVPSWTAWWTAFEPWTSKCLFLVHNSKE